MNTCDTCRFWDTYIKRDLGSGYHFCNNMENQTSTTFVSENKGKECRSEGEYYVATGPRFSCPLHEPK